MYGNLILKLAEKSDYYCGSDKTLAIPGKLINGVSMGITIIQIAVPILLIIFGMIDLGKAVMAQKEDEIKKGQQTFIKRLIAAVIVFFVVLLVKLVVGIVSDDKNVTSCIDCFVNANATSCKIKNN